MRDQLRNVKRVSDNMERKGWLCLAGFNWEYTGRKCVGIFVDIAGR